MTGRCTTAARCGDWQTLFLTLLPALERQARRCLVHCPPAEREEARQYILAAAALAVARLAERGRAELAYPAPLARYGYRHYRAGRLIGGQRRTGGPVTSLDRWQETLPERAGTTPAELAALRLDFGAWLAALSPRDRQVIQAYARGERTRDVARMLGVTAGRASQLRRALYDDWRRFTGEEAGGASDVVAS